ncbi:unnamed protein product [Durusdinium trenchii]|uniref:Uncharacterized protein n=1 Tax=Durusdinium trenchii TaxID=1381693 RepID=A0ABP0NTS9_9DINO
MSRVDWKVRYHHFKHSVPTFCSPFSGREITSVAHPDEVAYLRCRLCTDVVAEGCSQGVYLEVEVASNSDNLSMAVVDFEAGGCSSVTFSPDTGAVIRERKVREAPRKVEGAYIQPLPTVTTGRPFHGLMGEIPSQRYAAAFSAFDRRQLGPWETTGFVSDLDWAEGRRLTPCLAFRDEGAYRVRRHHLMYRKLLAKTPKSQTGEPAGVTLTGRHDMEITLGNLTPSTPDNPVHLAWWAPRKSQTAWNPHLNLAGCAVYPHMNFAYPKYDDEDFNGGNLQVGSNGQVTIRFRAPSTYFVSTWISVPHVHLRLCSNDTFAHTTQDAIVFVKDGPELVAGEAGVNMCTFAQRLFKGNNNSRGV